MFFFNIIIQLRVAKGKSVERTNEKFQMNVEKKKKYSQICVGIYWSL